jgi:site-specific DNA-methyltransferase (adenine-specific)
MEHINKIINADCLEILPQLPDESIDAVICDLPYGTTECRWDSIIDLDRLWTEYRRLIKPTGAIVLFGAQPFSSLLVTKALDLFKYEWIWYKNKATGYQTVKTQPMRIHENILVFSKGTVANRSPRNMVYNPQGLIESPRTIKIGHFTRGRYLGQRANQNGMVIKSIWSNYPKSVLHYDKESKYIHPTQKPLPLVEYLVATYTNPGDVILDNASGSGTLAVAALKLDRRYICIEQDTAIYDQSLERVNEYERTRRDSISAS